MMKAATVESPAPERSLATLRQELFTGTNELFQEFFQSIADQLALTPEQAGKVGEYLHGNAEKRDKLSDLIKSLEEEAERLREREKQIATRRHEFESIARMFRESVLVQMQNFGNGQSIKRVDSVESSFRVQKNPPKVEITDEKLLPGQYITYQPVPDKRAIMDDLSAGKDIPGAKIADPTYRLEIR